MIYRWHCLQWVKAGALATSAFVSGQRKVPEHSSMLEQSHCTQSDQDNLESNRPALSPQKE